MKITTIKLNNATKERLDKLRVYQRETYDEILGEALDILSLCRISPERARGKLLVIERERRRRLGLKPSSPKREQSLTPQNNPQSYEETHR
jgi:hypothetical protein